MAEKKIEAGSIQIEDPLDFLSPAEKKEYIRAHQDTLLRSEEELRRIREATEEADEDEPEDLFETEELYEDEEDEYEEYEERPAYVYKDTRLHTDERRSRAAKTEKKVKSAPAKPAQRRTARAAEADRDGDEEVDETIFDYILSVLMKAFLAAILIVALIMVYMIYVRPVIRRATGMQNRSASVQEEGDTTGTGEAQGAAPSGEAEQAVQNEAPAEGDAVVTTTQLNLRTAPNTETSEVIWSAPPGTRLTRLSDDGTWSKVSWNGQELYCASEYLKAE